MKILDVPQSGSRGRVVASRNRAGQYLKERVTPDQPGTAAQQAVWDNMTDISWLWNQLGAERWQAWRRLAEQVHSRPNLGQRGRLDGCQLFKKLNSVLATCRQPYLLDPPPLPQFGRNPVEGFDIQTAGGLLVCTLRLSPKVGSQARSPLEQLMVYGWTPCNAGTARNGLYAFLGLLPPRLRAQHDIAEMYLAKLREWRQIQKKRYQLPLEGSRVFVRVCQMMNGWQNEVGMFQASALVQVSGRRAQDERAARLRRLLLPHDQQ